MLNFSFNGNNDCILRLFRTTLNLTFPLVKETNLLMKCARYFSFFEVNVKHIATCSLSSNNHQGITSSSFFVLKFLIVSSMTYFDYIENTIKNFTTKKDDLIILLWLFDERKQVIICLLFSLKDEKYSV